MAFTYGDHDVRFLDSLLEEVYELAGRHPPASVFMVFERGYALYCPACGTYSIVPYSAEPMDPATNGREAAVQRARHDFVASCLESCGDQRRRHEISEVMES